MQPLLSDPFGLFVPIAALVYAGCVAWDMRSARDATGADRFTRAAGLAAIAFTSILTLAMFSFTTELAKDKANASLFTLVAFGVALELFGLCRSGGARRASTLALLVGAIGAMAVASGAAQAFVLPVRSSDPWNMVVISAAAVTAVLAVMIGRARTVLAVTVLILSVQCLGNYYNRAPWRNAPFTETSTYVRDMMPWLAANVHAPFVMVGPAETMTVAQQPNGAVYRALSRCSYNPPSERQISAALRTSVATGAPQVNVLVFPGASLDDMIDELATAMPRGFVVVTERRSTNGFQYYGLVPES